jgi:hypothetical protein
MGKMQGFRPSAIKINALALAVTLWLASNVSARAAILDGMVTEFQSWQVAFDGGFLPVAVTAGVLAVVIASIFSRTAAFVVFVVVCIGAMAYGTRDILVGLAGGGA